MLDYFAMQPVADKVPIYRNPDSQITLTISGIGKPAAAAAVTRTRDYFKAGRSHAWLNLGIAGHASLPLGQAVIIKKVTDAASGQTWFPSRVFDTTLPAHDLLTLEQPSSDYLRPGTDFKSVPSPHYRKELFDMECAGFFQAVTGFATLELVQAVKIISDNADQPMEGVNPKLISRLMRQNLPVVEEIIQQLLSLSALQQRLNDPGPDYHAIIRERHFSVSQQYQLQAALRKWRALYPEDTGLAERLAGKNSAREALKFLRDELGKAPIKFR